MFEDPYSEYIRSILGYPAQSQQTMNNMEYEYNLSSQKNLELEDCYPEIYKIIYPMVTKACSSNRKIMTRDEIEKITDEIYFSIKDDYEININCKIANELHNNVKSSNKIENSAENRGIKDGRQIKDPRREIEERNDRNIKPTNKILRDLIKILLLRELNGKPQVPNRPPIVPTPFPQFSGRPGPRPPIRPRMYENQYGDLYEN